MAQVEQNLGHKHAQVVVDETVLEPIDPLFVTPGFRYYDLDADRAQALDPVYIDVKGDDGHVKSTMTVRFSYLPVTFASIDKSKGVQDKKNQNWRVTKVRVEHVIRKSNGE